MVTEQDKTLEAVQMGIHMEIDGKEYYLKVSQESSNELGKKLLGALSIEEDNHRQRFVRIYDAIREQKGWPVIILQSDGGKELRTVFAAASEEISLNVEPLSTELGAIEKAMDMENKTYDYYQSRGEQADYGAEREFYRKLSVEEKEHHRLLLDYYEYLKNPATWFVQKERHSMDGG